MSESIKTIGIIGVALLFVAIVVVGAMGNPFETMASPMGNAVVDAGASEGIQEVTLRFNKNYEYELSPSTLKIGVPVRMTVDMTTVRGCLQDIVIPEFGVNKFVSKENNIIEFTPTKKGTIGIQCSMNMGRGSFTVN